MTTGNKIMWKRGESNFSSFPHYFIHIFLTFGVKLHIHLLNVVVQFIIFLTLSTLICRCTDISKCFSKSLGVRDNESRLYLFSLIATITFFIGKILFRHERKKKKKQKQKKKKKKTLRITPHAIFTIPTKK